MGNPHLGIGDMLDMVEPDRDWNLGFKYRFLADMH
jgi:hypothetical protein